VHAFVRAYVVFVTDHLKYINIDVVTAAKIQSAFYIFRFAALDKYELLIPILFSHDWRCVAGISSVRQGTARAERRISRSSLDVIGLFSRR
jgi:hypothetical protein